MCGVAGVQTLASVQTPYIWSMYEQYTCEQYQDMQAPSIMWSISSHPNKNMGNKLFLK